MDGVQSTINKGNGVHHDVHDLFAEVAFAVAHQVEDGFDGMDGLGAVALAHHDEVALDGVEKAEGAVDAFFTGFGFEGKEGFAELGK